ncbi:MAG: RNA polymerase factor sigma-54 [Lentisphaeria bacterium]|nr:RNA polymerase factor sigma-54 [Lentisphaeria bacterium]
MAGTELNHTQTGMLTQQQHLSHSQHQALELLSLPLTALESRLLQEFAVNPVLEELPPENLPERPEETAGENTDENDYETNAVCAEEWSDDLPLPPAEKAAPDVLDYLGNSPAPPPSLKTRLLTELSFADCPPELYAPAVEIISSLNDDGFLNTNLADIAMTLDVEISAVNDALVLVQMIAPPGVAARDVAESLKLQLMRSGKMTPDLERLLSEGVEDLEKNRLPALCTKLGVTPEELEKMLRTLRTLNPVPGREKNNTAAVITPDLTITRTEDGNYTAAVRWGNYVRIGISKMYSDMLQKPALSAEDRHYLLEKIQRGKELIEALALREKTLKRIGDVIIAEQRDFLDRGVKALRSMTMKQVAATLELSESTISRAVAEKFADTPQGIFPLRFFFSGGYGSEDGKDVSSQAVKELIRNAISAEDPHHPLSDDALSVMLKDQGINVARRTVAKYRESLNIPSSSLRKKHF